MTPMTAQSFLLNKPMRILIVNDDGIRFEGILVLADLARQFGDVTVVAPAQQCSAMSHCITVKGELTIREETFPVEEVKAYSVSGTPADCVKVALEALLPEKPDLIFSGINDGYNVARDIIYSGTVGAAMDGAMHGIVSIAYSLKSGCSYDVVRAYFKQVTELILSRKIAADEIWNVNFPGCSPEDVKGILFDRKPADISFYQNRFRKVSEESEDLRLEIDFVYSDDRPEGTDLEAVNDNFISIGKVKNMAP